MNERTVGSAGSGVKAKPGWSGLGTSRNGQEVASGNGEAPRTLRAGFVSKVFNKVRWEEEEDPVTGRISWDRTGCGCRGVERGEEAEGKGARGAGTAIGVAGTAISGKGAGCGCAEAGGAEPREAGRGVAAGKPADERGAVSVAFVIMLSLLLMMAAFAIDLGIAHIEKATQNDLAEQVEADQMKSANALLVKNSDTPQKDLAQGMISELRELGYAGEITAYYYEPKKAESGLDDSERVYVFGLTLTQDQPTIFGTMFGTKELTVSTTKWSWANPYAQSYTYHPTSAANGIAHVNAGEDASKMTWSNVANMNENQMPGGKDVLATAIKSAKES